MTLMANIVCITTGLTGILHASFELMDRLEAAGHQVICASPENVGVKVQAQGFRYEQLPPLNLDPEPKLPKFSGPLRKVKRWWYKLNHRQARRKQALHTIGLPEIREKLASFSADLLLIDIELHEYIFVAASAEMPFVLLSQWFSLWKRPGLPYLLHDTIPGEGWKGHDLALALSWQRVRWQRKWMFAKKNWMSVGTDRRSTLLQAADQLGFSRRMIRDNYWPGPFTYRELPVISMTAWEMEFPHNKPQQLTYVGPMVFSGRKEIPLNAVDQKRMDQLLERPRQKDEALIYCSVSSLKSGDRQFLNKVCHAVAKEPKWTLILGMGGLIELDQLENIAENIHPFSWVPQLKVLEQANCSINHGGIHTINECIHYQVPMLVYSGKRSDQNGCAARVTYHELGLCGDKDRDSVEDIHRKIRQVLNSDLYRFRVERMHQRFQAYRAEKKLEKTVDKFLI